MVWFQCEDCGDNLKKPKLPNHFRICSATKLSCIDCGSIFGQESVQGHTQCMTEMEKYGPKGQGQGKAVNGATAKPNKDGKQQSNIDINVGLSERPPWFCSLCNTNATSRQALLLHAEGKKHRGKARAFHAANQPKKTEESAAETKPPSENPQKSELLGKKDGEEPKVQDNNFEENNGNFQSNKKRKSDKTDENSSRKKTKDDLAALGNGEVIQGGKTEAGGIGSQEQDKVSESRPAIEETKTKIKWNKLIKSALKSSPDGVLKMKKLRKTVFKALQESGITGDEDELKKTLEQKINSSSRFTVENKYVRLVAKD